MKSTPISVLDLYKTGIGPSSSHTLGPWRAAQRFIASLTDGNQLGNVVGLQVLLYGSLAKTGIGHGTDIALVLGLSGEDPAVFEFDVPTLQIATIRETTSIYLAGRLKLSFDIHRDIIYFSRESLPYHPNAMSFLAMLRNGEQITETYYSVGGGFIEKERENARSQLKGRLSYPFSTAENLLNYTRHTGKPIWHIVLTNESKWRIVEQTQEALLKIWKTMRLCMYRGAHTSGILPGGLGVERRAASINRNLLAGVVRSDYESWTEGIRRSESDFGTTLSWLSCFALAVTEENAAFGRIVTAPTNGASGVIPAVLQYAVAFHRKTEEDCIRFLLTAGAIGMIFKNAATISAAMGGCQAEIGVSSAMAAAALTEIMGGTAAQCLMAAEMAMEHHLGLTCDPVAGLVQVPCIERNAMGAIKAVTASQLALQSDPAKAVVSLDQVARTMLATGMDMRTEYKETAEGGLAIVVGATEC